MRHVQQVSRRAEASVDDIEIVARGDRSCTRPPRRGSGSGAPVPHSRTDSSSGLASSASWPRDRRHARACGRATDRRRTKIASRAMPRGTASTTAATRTRSDALHGRLIPPRCEAVLFQTPQQDIETVLPEERLALERHGRHAPVAALRVRSLVGLDDRFVLVGIGGDLRDPARRDRGPARAAAFARWSPSCQLSISPDQMTRLTSLRKSAVHAARFSRSAAEPCQAMDIGLVRHGARARGRIDRRPDRAAASDRACPSICERRYVSRIR